MNADERLSAILEGIGEGFYAVDENWRIVLFNEEASRHFGRRPDECLGRILWEVFPGSRETSLGGLYMETMASRQPVRSETPSVVVPDRWLAYRLFPLERGLGVVFRDVTDRRKAEQQRDLLIGELGHRVKNTLALVQAIAARSFRKSGPNPELEDFDNRLAALGQAHSVLTNAAWEGADIRDVVRNAVSPFEQNGRRFSIAGDSIILSPKRAVTLSMALHELATNAVKYGALSNDSGQVSIQWRNGDRDFSLEWLESGGPPVGRVMRRGFGSLLIEKALATELQGRAQILFDPDGVRCVIEAPASSMRESETAIDARAPL